MPQFYTVTMVRKQTIKKYDDKGRFVAEETKELPVVFHDLPLPTAQMYRDKFPDAKVTIAEQAQSIDHEARKKFGRPAYKKARPDEYVPITDDAPSIAPRRSSTHTAAATGDMAAAINAELKERS